MAAKKPGPVLLVRQDAIPQSVQEELFRLRPETIVVLGGPAAVSDRVVEKLQDTNYTQSPVIRVAGVDRYETAAKLSAGVFAPGVPVAYVATGTDFADALSGGAAAGAEGGPLLLVRPGDIPATTAAELDRLNPAKIVVLGGTSGHVERGAVRPRRLQPLGAPPGRRRSLRDLGADLRRRVPGEHAGGLDRHRRGLPGRASPASAPPRSPRRRCCCPGQVCIPASVDAEIDRLNPSSLIVLGGPNALSDSVLYRGRCGLHVID